MTEQDDLLFEDDSEAFQIVEILDGIEGAWEQARKSIEQAKRGETVPLSEV